MFNKSVISQLDHKYIILYTGGNRYCFMYPSFGVCKSFGISLHDHFKQTNKQKKSIASNAHFEQKISLHEVHALLEKDTFLRATSIFVHSCI